MTHTVHLIWPVADIQTGIKEEGLGTGHEDGHPVGTLVVQRAVRGMRHEHGESILAGRADDWPETVGGTSLSTEDEQERSNDEGQALHRGDG